MKSNLTDTIKLNGNYAFVSPHIDDAIFSCGGLISKLRENGANITIINVFTKTPTAKDSLSAKTFLKQCGIDNAEDLYKQRIAEENILSEQTCIKVINLGYTEALWRENKSLIGKLFGKWIPELKLIYPIYRLNACCGKTSKQDDPMIQEITEKLTNICKELNLDAVFGPIGFGGHVDHLVAKKSVESLNYTKYLWADYPYILRKKQVIGYATKYKITKVEPNWDTKLVLMKMYKNQYDTLFRKEKPKPNTELYYEAKTIIDRKSVWEKLKLFLKILFRNPIETIFILTYPTNQLVDIYDFDPKVYATGQEYVKKIKDIFPEIEISLMGSTALKIMGQKDLDIFIQCSPSKFKLYAPKIQEIVGIQGKTRDTFIEWDFTIGDIDVQLVMMDPEGYMCKRKIDMYNRLANNLDEYVKFKHNALGMTLREYEYAKQIFFCIDLKTCE